MDRQKLISLCSLDGVSGHESAVRRFILDELDKLTTPHETSVDAMGNILVHIIGKTPAKTRLLLDAHMDEVGFLVTGITDDGFLRFDTVGAISSHVLFGQRVRIGSVPGVIGGKAVHQCSKEEREAVPGIDDMLIDIGAKNKDEAKTLVSLGNAGTFDRSLMKINGETVALGKAIDDRLGCALLLSLAEHQPSRDYWLSFSVQEEVGARGAGVVSRAVNPDIAIAVESTSAGDTVASSEDTAVCHMNRGPVVSFADRSTLYDAELYAELRRLAEENGIPTQTKKGITGGNNSGAIQRSGEGVRMGAVSLPCRYIHSPSCLCSLTDSDNMEKLLSLVIERFTQ